MVMIEPLAVVAAAAAAAVAAAAAQPAQVVQPTFLRPSTKQISSLKMLRTAFLGTFGG
jgi:hypothetical protein